MKFGHVRYLDGSLLGEEAHIELRREIIEDPGHVIGVV